MSYGGPSRGAQPARHNKTSDLIEVVAWNYLLRAIACTRVPRMGKFLRERLDSFQPYAGQE